MIENSNIRYIIAHAFIRKLWADGLITEEEMLRINARNKVAFGT